MAIALDIATNGGHNSNVSSKTYSHTVTGSNLILVVFVCPGDTTLADRTVSGITYNGTPLTHIAADSDRGYERTEAWYLINPSTGANNIVVTMGGSCTDLDVYSYSLTGAKQSAQPDSSHSRASASATPVTDATTTVADNSWVLSAAQTVGTQTTGVSAGQTGTSLNTGWTASSYSGPKTPVGSATHGYTVGSSTDAAMTIISIAPATGVSDLTVSKSETVTLSESIGRLLESNVNKSDSITVTENVNNALVHQINVSDNIALTENIVKVLESNINKSDTVTITENSPVALVHNINKSDSITITENKIAELNSFINKSDSIIITESTSVSFPLMSTLKDDFEFGGNDTGKWNTWGSISATATTNLVAELTSTLAANYGGYLSNQKYNLTSSYAFAQLVDAGNQSITSLEVYPIELTTGSDALSIMINSNTVYARKKISGSYTTVGSTVAYNSTTMKWFRISESGGTTTWAYATDPTSTWTTIATLANPIAITSLTGGITIGTWQAEGSTSTVKVDNFNCLPGENQFTWKGYTWNKRIHVGDPANKQEWSPDNVSVDGSGYLHVNITNPTGVEPVGSEVFSAQRGFGYGEYTAVIATRLDNIGSPSSFGGMFTFDFTNPPAYREIDVNETRDYEANPNKRILHSHVWDNGGSREFIVDQMDVPSDVIQTHRLTWEPGQIIIDSYLGTGTGGTNYFHTVHATHLPTPGLERVHFNTFVDILLAGYRNVAPLDVIIRDFSFTPLSTVGVSDSVTVTESVKTALAHQINVSDSVTISESVGKLLEANINKTENITVSENIARILESIISVSDNITLSENISTFLTPLYISKSENITVSESVGRVLESNATKTESIILTENNIVTILPDSIIKFDSAINGGLTNPGTSLTWAHTIGSFNNRILFVGVFGASAGDLVTGATYNGVAMTLINKIQVPSDRWVYLYYLLAPAIGANNVIVSASSSTAIAGDSSSYYNVAQSGQPDAQTTATVGSAASLTASVTTIADNCWTFMVTKGAGGSLPFAGSGTYRRATGNDMSIFDSAGQITPAQTTSLTAQTAAGNKAFASIIASFSPSSDINISVSDSIAVSENKNIALAHQINVNESLTVSENINRVLESFVNVSDLITVSENSNVSFIVTGDPLVSVLENISLTESVNLLLISNINASDSIGIADTIQLDIPIEVNVSENITVSESKNITLAHQINVSDAITLSESNSELLEGYISVLDSITVSQQSSVDEIIAITSAENITVSENIIKDIPINIAVIDNITVTENKVINIPINIAIFENISVAEVATIFTDKLYLSVSEHVSVADVSNVAFVYLINKSENITLTENIVLTQPHIVEYINKKLIFVDGRLAYLIVDAQGIPHYTFI